MNEAKRDALKPEGGVVAVPLVDTFDLYADNDPGVDVQEVRLSIYTKGNYTALKNRIVRKLLSCGITITGRQYIGYERTVQHLRKRMASDNPAESPHKRESPLVASAVAGIPNFTL